jgi:hypothetical protein
VLEHIEDDREVLVNAFRYLKPRGYLILLVPFGKAGEELSKRELDNGHVRKGYTGEDIREKLECCGFEIVLLSGSVGRIGRLSCRLASLLADKRIIFNLSILALPIIYILVYLEQAASLARRNSLPFEYSPLAIARNPL